MVPPPLPSLPVEEQASTALGVVKARQAAGDFPSGVTPSARADWAYGNAVIENADVTREMADAAVRAHGRP